MSEEAIEQFKLVFSGEIAEGQHQAVVKKRLAEALKLGAGAADKLFAGGTVVLKKAATREVAARLQKVFREAGARLRVQPLNAASAGSGAPSDPEDRSARKPGEPLAAVAADTVGGLEVLPPQVLPSLAGKTPVQVDTSHIALAEDGLPLQESVDTEEPIELDLSRFALAEPGATLLELDTSAQPEAAPIPEMDAELLAPGEGVETAPETPVTVIDANFELADAGETLAPAKTSPTPNPPDVSHLDVIEPDDGSVKSG